jgi:putative polyketide hydroxylase
MDHEGQAISMLDLFGRNFVLLAGNDGEAWCSAARELKFDMDVHRIEEPRFADAYGITPSGAVLVRPDGFVAWRAKTGEGASGALLAGALQAILKL